MKWLFHCLWILAASPGLLGRQASDPGLFRQVLEHVSIRNKAGAFVGRGDYGVIGYGILDLSIVTLGSPRTAFFAGDVSIFGGAGIGSRYKVGDRLRPLTMKTYLVGISFPVLDLSRVFDVQHPIVVQISPFYENALTRNYRTGNHVGVRGPGIGASLTGYFADGVGISIGMSTFRGGQPRRAFVWDPRFDVLSLGFHLNVGTLLKTSRKHEVAYAQLQRHNVRIETLLEQASADRDSLQRTYEKLRDSVFTSVVRLADLLHVNVRPKPSTTALKVTTRIEGESNVHDFDPTRKPSIQVIRIDKHLFESGNLVEEEYLKTVLTVLGRHADYVWEIAYRDSTIADFGDGRTLAQAIGQFFQIYDSRLRNKLRVTFDPALRPEFEIRCLGLARKSLSHRSD